MRYRNLAIMTACVTGMSLLGASLAGPITVDFEGDSPGKIAAGFVAKAGRWEVALDKGNHVFAQLGKSEDDVFNLVLLEKSNAKNLDLSVRLRRVTGELDQGGGLVWRAKDAKNYYIARYNPLENNFRVYKVVNGVRTMFKDAKTPGDDAWHTLRITMMGNRITCMLDGVKYHEVLDDTFADAGMIGLWTKSDAQTYFDGLALSALD